MKNTCSHLCKGVFLAFFILASIACDTPSVTDTPKQTEKTPDEQDTPKVADIGKTAEKAIVEGAYANQGIAEVNFKQDSDITDIRGGAFKGNKITQLQLPDTVERVGKDAFKGNPLKTLTLGEKLDLTKVQKDAFATSENTLTVVLKKPQPNGIDAEALARVFGKKTVQFEADPAISGPEKATLDTHVATLNEEGAKVPNLRTVSFYDGEALITQTHGTTGKPVAQPEPALLPSKTGQRIENWYEAPDPSGSAFDFDTAITKDMSLYAKWGSAPTIERIAFTSPVQIYKANDVIEVTVTFTEAVAVVTTDGTPQVVLKIGIEDKEAEYKSGKSTPKTLVFEYTVQAGDTDANGIEIVANQLDANGGTIKKASTAIDIPAVLVHERVHAPTMTVDTTAPTVETIAFTSPEKTYKATDVIQVTVTFSEVVDVEGTPQVVLKIGSANKNAVYKSGKSTETTLVFEYTVEDGDEDANGIEIPAGTVALNGGTIKDTVGNPATLATLTHTAVDADTARTVDTTAPEVKTIAFTSPEKTYKANEVIQVTVTFSEAVDVDTNSGTPKVVLKIGTVEREAEYKSGKSTPKTLVFEYTVQAGETDENGIEIEQDKLNLNGGTITDAVGNTATLAHTEVAADDKRTVDTSVYTFAFIPKEHKQAYTDGGTYKYEEVTETKPDPANRTFTYTSSNEDIATVDNAGIVTFVTAGTVIITATKDAEGDHEKVTDSYTLYITKKPADKTALVEEIRRAMTAHGNEVNLNYIDTSAITNMEHLFSSHKTNGYGLGTFNGAISKWDVREVTTMKAMFKSNTAFNQDISQWWDRLGKVITMQSMFFVATKFNSDISKWQVGSVTRMSAMFYGATAFNQDISGWNISAVTSMVNMFQSATAFDRDLDSWANKIHADIKANSWAETSFMFAYSGLKDSLPSWCETSNCKNQQ